MANGNPKGWVKFALLVVAGVLIGLFAMQQWGGGSEGGITPDPTPVPTPAPATDPDPSPAPDPTPAPDPDPTPAPSPSTDPDPSTFADKSVGGTLTGTFAWDGDVGVWEDAWYDTAPEVALYIHTFGWLPGNYITKKQAREDYGWEGGTLRKLAPGMSLGGDVFGNNEKKLPRAKGRTWYEADLETTGKKSRGEKRILFSSDGLIYYTSDHYESYTQLY